MQTAVGRVHRPDAERATVDSLRFLRLQEATFESNQAASVELARARKENTRLPEELDVALRAAPAPAKWDHSQTPREPATPAPLRPGNADASDSGGGGNGGSGRIEATPRGTAERGQPTPRWAAVSTGQAQQAVLWRS